MQDTPHRILSTMKPPELFSLATRLAGLWILLSSLPGLPYTLSKLGSALVNVRAGAAVEILLSLVWVYVVAWWFLTGAPWLQQLVYPNSRSDKAASNPPT
tara:strand:+ start:445 stop:744 length:300 start_codon:yes stop_codon:yes gene_type:complete